MAKMLTLLLTIFLDKGHVFKLQSASCAHFPNLPIRVRAPPTMRATACLSIRQQQATLKGIDLRGSIISRG